MVDLLHIIMKHSFFSSMIIVSGVILAFVYSKQATSSFGCLILVVHGPPETVKSKSLTTALALVGLIEYNIVISHIDITVNFVRNLEFFIIIIIKH